MYHLKAQVQAKLQSQIHFHLGTFEKDVTSIGNKIRVDNHIINSCSFTENGHTIA